MKISMAMMLLFIAFLAVALAEKEPEYGAPDPEVSRSFRCSYQGEQCFEDSTLKCCGRLKCVNNRCVGKI
nr:Tx-574 [Heteropoda pingtungensis]